MNLLLDLYERWPRATVQVLSHVVSIVIVTIAALVVVNLYAYVTAQAAPSDPVTLCTPVAMGGGITVFYCEPDYGPPFYLNSLGFMLLDN